MIFLPANLINRMACVDCTVNSRSTKARNDARRAEHCPKKKVIFAQASDDDDDERARHTAEHFDVGNVSYIAQLADRNSSTFLN